MSEALNTQTRAAALDSDGPCSTGPFEQCRSEGRSGSGLPRTGPGFRGVGLFCARWGHLLTLRSSVPNDLDLEAGKVSHGPPVIVKGLADVKSAMLGKESHDGRGWRGSVD